MELTLLHCPGHEHAESKVVPNALLPKAGAGSSLGTANPRRTQMGIADRIKSIPIVGEMAAWAAWIFRVRQIARIASRTEANLAKIHNQVARIDNQVARIDNQVARIDARLTGIDGRVGALEPLQRSFQELQRAFQDMGEQTAGISREVMFQQRRLSRWSEIMGKKRAPTREMATALWDQRLDSLYSAFEDKYRGSRADIKQRHVPYLAKLKLAGAGRKETPIVDIGCGRGEWLELLQENGLAAYGIDINSMMVERTTLLGLDARVADLAAHLRSLDDGSRSAVTAFHVVEHLAFDVLVDFLDQALRVLMPGGILIVETPNPENMRVGATTFYNDPTHRNPILPEPLAFIVEHRGFSDVEILRLHPGPESERLEGEGPDIAHLNALLFGPRDYAIIARRL